MGFFGSFMKLQWGSNIVKLLLPLDQCLIYVLCISDFQRAMMNLNAWKVILKLWKNTSIAKLNHWLLQWSTMSLKEEKTKKILNLNWVKSSEGKMTLKGNWQNFAWSLLVLLFLVFWQGIEVITYFILWLICWRNDIMCRSKISRFLTSIQFRVIQSTDPSLSDSIHVTIALLTRKFPPLDQCYYKNLLAWSTRFPQEFLEASKVFHWFINGILWKLLETLMRLKHCNNCYH